jgi:type II secretory pathway component PulM
MQAEGVLLMQQENAYLKQRVVALNVRVRELAAEVEELRAPAATDKPSEEE